MSRADPNQIQELLDRIGFNLHKGLQGDKDVYILTGRGKEAFFYSLDEVQCFLGGFDAGGMIAYDTMYNALGEYGLAPLEKKASLMVETVRGLAEYFQTTQKNSQLLNNN